MADAGAGETPPPEIRRSIHDGPQLDRLYRQQSVTGRAVGIRLYQPLFTAFCRIGVVMPSLRTTNSPSRTRHTGLPWRL